MGMWVPWRPGSTAAHQRAAMARKAAKKRAKGRPVKGITSGKAAAERARKKHRQQALKDLRAKRITVKQYHKRLDEIG